MGTRADNIIFCLKASNVEGAGASASSIMSVMTPEYIPGLFSFSVIVIILGVDTSITHQFCAQLKEPGGCVVTEVNGSLDSVQTEQNVPDEYNGLNVSIDFSNVNLKTSGLYHFIVYIDNAEIGTKDIYVKGKNE